MSTIVTLIIGVLLAGATIAGVATSVGDHHHHKSANPVPAAKLYGSR